MKLALSPLLITLLLISSSLTSTGQSLSAEVLTRDLDLPKELRNVAANLTADDLATQQWVASQPGVKIAVRTDGLYRVTRNELMNAGFDLSGDPANWRLFLNGVEQAIIVDAAGQYIEFLGRGLDTRESDTRIYYLIAGDVAGRRITSKILRTIGGNVVSTNYRVTVTKKERMAPYISRIVNGEEENYWGRLIQSLPPTQVQFNVTGLDITVPRYLMTVRVQAIQGLDHNVKVVLNGHDVGYLTGGVNQSLSEDYLLPSSYFVDGPNALSLNETQSGRACLFDSVALNYSRYYQAEGNALSFYTPGYRRVDLTGFPTSDIRLFDTTLDGSPVQISNLDVVAENGTFTIRLPSSRAMTMYGMTEAVIRTSPSVTANIPSTLSAPGNAAEFVIISHSSPEFIAAAETWADYRRSPRGGGVSAKVVDIADIYDEFSYGVHTAAGISNFLRFATTSWATPTRYVLLIGDASWDPRNYEGHGYLDSVPTYMAVQGEMEETGSDEALADFDNDGVAEVAIGRVPVRTASDIKTVLNKTMAFETPKMQSLERGALFAYSPGYYEPALALAGELPPAMPKTFVGRDDPKGHTALINGINAGKFIVNYSGHATTGIWGATAFFRNDDIPTLTNSGRESIFTVLKCYNGMFFRPQFDSMGELLLKAPNGGAVTVWAATSETPPVHELMLGTRFYNQIGVGQIQRMGDLVRDAKSSIAGSSVPYSWTLLGDPMLRVRAGSAK